MGMEKTAVHDSTYLTARALFPFGGVALAWIVLSALLCHQLGKPADFGSNLRWLAVLALLSLADLYSLAKLCGFLLRLASAAPGRTLSILQASYWGTFKIACLLLFGVSLSLGRSPPLPGVLTGVSTLVVVPCFGGLFWHWMREQSQRSQG